MTSSSTGALAEKKSILVVDDCSVLCCAYGQALRAWGYEVDVAEDGLAGLECLKTARYHLVISDYEMPRCNGIDFLRRYRAEIDRDAEIPFILITGTPIHLLSGRLDGFARTLNKPFDFKCLKGALEETLLISNNY